MKLIFGKWTQKECEEIRHSFEDAFPSMPHYKGTVIVPYTHEPPTIVELPRQTKPIRFWISSYAHKVH